MKISPQTLTVLKNFQNINKSLLFKKGNEIRTLAEGGTIFAIAKIEEEIPKDAAIYELSKLINSLSLYKEPELIFGDYSFDVVDAERKRSAKITYTDPSMIFAPPYDKNMSIKDIDVQFDLSSEDFSNIVKAGSNLGLKDFVVMADGEKMFVGAMDTLVSSSDRYLIEIGDIDANFRYVIKFEHLKFINSGYRITIGSSKINFENELVSYYIALEAKKTIKKG